MLNHDYEDMTFIKLYMNDNSIVQLEPGDEPVIYAAMNRRLANPTKDELIELTTIFGNSFKALISTVTGWLVSYPDSRKNEQEWDKQVHAAHHTFDE